MNTLIISSSLSKTSRSFILCKAIHALLQEKGVNAELLDAREMELLPCHKGASPSMEELTKKVEKADNIIFGMGVHCYSVNDGLKIILDNCCGGSVGKFFGIVCAAGGERSYLSTMHLTQICMNEWRMIQLPRIVYATGKDFTDDTISNDDLKDRIKLFAEEFSSIGEKLIS
ncbi:MAG: NAD(P)H-dependent oxidoreductase [Flavobacteriales bacterium]|nr:NAD(P)H-dependent oxidoreductase [Flavobacteriales bacterium]